MQWLARLSRIYYVENSRFSLQSAGFEVRSGAGKRRVSIPNIITLGRIMLVPIIVWAIVSSQMKVAFGVFLIAGISDAVDGFLAKRFNMTSELGALLDPLADKALLVSIYMALGIWGAIPRWIVILVVSRDIMIVGAVIIGWLLDNPLEIRPLLVSKLNTTAQIGFAAAVLAAKAFGLPLGLWFEISLGIVAALTLASTGAYLRQWLNHVID